MMQVKLVERGSIFPGCDRSLSYQCSAAILYVAILSGLLSPRIASAEIILDEFISSARVESPAMRNNFVESSNVGDLDANRQIRITSNNMRPYGHIDIGLASPGVMALEITEIERIPLPINITAISGVQFDYFFEPTDVTEGGVNDAILFDFVELSGDVQPSFLRAIVRDNTDLTSRYEIRLESLTPSSNSFTLAAPFDGYTQRGGTPGLPDATTLQEIRFEFFFLGHEGELNWSAQLERIRFGSTQVPEPAAWPMLTGILLLSLLYLKRENKNDA